jgi:hypothetical protein
MSTIFCLVFFSLRSSLRSRAALHAEILALRHQLLVLQRSMHGRRLRLRTADRIFWGLAIPSMARLASVTLDRHTGNRHCLESERIPLVLDMEEPSTQWPAVRIPRNLGADQAHEHGQPTLGCSTYPRRTPETRHPSFRKHGRQVYGSSAQALLAKLANFSEESHVRSGLY